MDSVPENNYSIKEMVGGMGSELVGVPMKGMLSGEVLALSMN